MKKISLLALLALAVVSCQKEPTTPDQPTPDSQSNTLAYVLNEGLWGANDGSLARLDYQSGAVQNDFFASQNGRGLGDVAQDLQVYGSKLYVVVYGSSTLEVANAKDARSIKQISFAGRSPRFIVFHEDKAYVSCYNKYVYRLDTASLAIEDSCRLSGMQPEGMCVAGTKLCVANGWEYDNGGNVVYDNTISVVDLATFAEEKKIEVGLNPFRVMAAGGNKVLVGYWGDYGSVASGIQMVDIASGATDDLGIESSGFDLYNGSVYSYSFSYTTGQTSITRTDLATRQTESLLQNCGVNFKSCYGISVNPATGNIILLDSRQFRSEGDAYCFTPSGTLLWHAEVGKGPSKVVYL